MKRNIPLIVGLSSVETALAFVGPAGARGHGYSKKSSHHGSGRQVYQSNCAGCHGAGGKGKNGPKLAGASPDLGSIEWKVTDGGTKMPSFKKRLTPAQIKTPRNRS
jgi:mono/diheme cytochrome c family protein